MSILAASDLVKIYGEGAGEQEVPALGGVSLTAGKGEFIAIMGPSGSGKTTLLNMLSGIDRPTSGEVEIAGRDIHAFNSSEMALFRRRKMGFVFQDFNLLDSLTVKENIIVPMILEKKDAGTMEEKAVSLAKLVDISSVLEKYPHAISGGQQQRAAVCRALANDPEILFADEPTGNLDSRSSAAIMECFERITKELCSTVLVVTHDVFAASYCQKVLFLKDGLVHSSIVRKGGRKEFLGQIIDALAVVGGKTNDF